MAITKDWLTECAAEISTHIANTERPGPWFHDLESARAWIRAKIVQHMPFEEDAAYEKVDSGQIRELRKLLQESRREHRHCDDSWYCCGKCDSPDHGGVLDSHEGESPRTAGVCNCGADAWNARVDAFLSRWKLAAAQEENARLTRFVRWYREECVRVGLDAKTDVSGVPLQLINARAERAEQSLRESSERERTLREALKIVSAFAMPELSRGPAVPNWVEMVRLLRQHELLCDEAREHPAVKAALASASVVKEPSAEDKS